MKLKTRVLQLKIEKQNSLLKNDRKGVSLRQKEEYAQGLIERATESEKILRDALKRRGFKFEFQAVVIGYIPDFYFRERGWIVELDGKKFHSKRKDAMRDERFRKAGIKTLRIKSQWVFTNLNRVLKTITDRVYGGPVRLWKRRQKGRKKKLKIPPKRWQDVVADDLDVQFRLKTEGL